MNKKPSLELLKHYNKALRQVPGSPKQKDTIKQIDVLRNALRKAPIKEDGVGMVGGTPVNNAGSGEVAGIGVGSQGEPGIKKGRKKPIPFKSFFKRRDPAY